MKHFTTKLLLLTNHILLILHMSWLVSSGSHLSIQSIAPLLIASIMIADVSYISSGNIRENKVLSSFCGLLALNSWYVLLSFETSPIVNTIFSALSPVIWYASVRFLFQFLFQGSGYKFRKTTNMLLLICCINTIIGLVISDFAFACMYGIQFLVNIGCFLFIVFYHRERTLFVLRNERKYIFLSLLISGGGFAVYYFATANIPNHISNFGIYLPVLLFCMSVHGILLKEHASTPLAAVFSRKQSILIFLTAASVIGIVVFCLKGSFAVFIIGIHVFLSIIFLCNIILGQNLKQGNSLIMKENKYNAALNQLQQEERLKSEFSNFLHDEVLQDLLSIKNMMGKARRTDVQEIITQTLEDLNSLIRKQMQDYHPVILKNLTIKENFQNLIESISISYPQNKFLISFNCSDALFLVEPYDLLIYRFIKELVTNVYKHSDGNHVWITLLQEKGLIELNVSDNGTTEANNLNNVDVTKHKGFLSIREEITNMDGSVTVYDNTPHGVCIRITLPMKGDDSYQYFISR